MAATTELDATSLVEFDYRGFRVKTPSPMRSAKHCARLIEQLVAMSKANREARTTVAHLLMVITDELETAIIEREFEASLARKRALQGQESQ